MRATLEADSSNSQHHLCQVRQSPSSYLEHFREEPLSDLVEPEVVQVVERLDRRPDGVARQRQLGRNPRRSIFGGHSHGCGGGLLVDGRERRLQRGSPLGAETRGKYSGIRLIGQILSRQFSK